MPTIITLDAQASQFVEQKIAAGEATTADAYVSLYYGLAGIGEVGMPTLPAIEAS